MIVFRWRYLPIAVALVVAGSMILLANRPAIDSDPVADRFVRTRVMVDLCHDAVVFWSQENQRAPTTAEGLAVLGMKVAVPKDGYDRPLVYRHDHAKPPLQFVLYSLGPNGVDENGAGDDFANSEGG